MQQIGRESQTTQRNSDVMPEEINAQKFAFLDIAKAIIPGFAIDESNKKIISNLFNYFLNIPGELELSKGLFVMGDIGTGKSTLMQIFSKFKIFKNDGFLIHDCAHVANQYSINGDLDKYTYNVNGYCGNPVDMCFDELGRESIPANHFGQKLNVMQHILHIRYSLWQQKGLRTFITTNLGPSQVGELYGDFVRDRCREMFNVIMMEGASRRK